MNKKENSELFEGCAPMLRKLAKKYDKILPATACHMDSEDLFQEACIEFILSLGNYDSSRGASFATHLYNNVDQRLRSIVNAQYRQKRGGGVVFPTSLDEELMAKDYSCSSERSAMIFQFLERAWEEYPMVVEVVIDGIPKDLYRVGNRLVKQKSFRNDYDIITCRYSIPSRIFRKYFKINVNNLRKLYYKIVEGKSIDRKSLTKGRKKAARKH